MKIILLLLISTVFSAPSSSVNKAIIGLKLLNATEDFVSQFNTQCKMKSTEIKGKDIMTSLNSFFQKNGLSENELEKLRQAFETGLQEGITKFCSNKRLVVNADNKDDMFNII